MHLVQDGMQTNTISNHMDRLSACHDGGGPHPSARHSMVCKSYLRLECSRHGIDAPRQCRWNRVQDAIKRTIHTT